ncbi:MAG: 6-phosphofructokinase, partial [Oscillospiraceae bacterium]|nr:6-phosphofructokinase [Oscillospiraceae bacterium]
GNAPDIAQKIQKLTGIKTNAVVLGHVQRGGTPTAQERVIASMMGHHAVELIGQGIGKRVVVYRAGKVVDYDIEEALAMHKTIDMDMYNMAIDISI